jgi:DNA invertase Pin-like site-specific DNA recombinase
MARKIIRPLPPASIAVLGTNRHGRGLRVAVYVRVSSEEQLEGYSLDAQLRAIRAYCAERGWEIVVEYVEEGKSARNEDLSRRPRFKAMLDAADARQVDAIVVHKLDRFARNLLVLLTSLNRLGRADVSFVSVSEQIDYSTPQGRLFLIMLGALAEWYSNNLSQETKKGKRERKAQGLYNGLLPFGVVAGPDGLPIEDRRPFCVLSWVERDGRRVVDGGRETCNFAGLRLAFRLASEGASDRTIARALNAAGYRTTGNRGQNPFQKDSVAELLTNRFYWGDLPVYEQLRDGAGPKRAVQVGWTPGRHPALEGFDEAPWERLQAMREQNRKRPAKVQARARTYALSGLATCRLCGAPIRIKAAHTGRPRLLCRTRLEDPGACGNRLTYLSVYEEQIGAYLGAFRLPEDYQERLLAAMRSMGEPAGDADQERRALVTRLERIKELYEWGDYPRDRYLGERAALQERLRALGPAVQEADDLEARAAVVKSVSAAWWVAEQAERNRLARTLLEDLLVEDDRVVGIKPRAAFAPFFALSHEEWLKEEAPGEHAGGGTPCTSGGSDGDRFGVVITRRAHPARAA